MCKSVICDLFLEAPQSERQPKQALYIYITKYIPQLIEERMSLYSSINRGIYGHVAGAHERWGYYIHLLYVIEEYIPLYLSITRN
jgi:hypothetical protein